ncbi:hypothetical protein L1987_07814 [Smallanthus sonchifolius]|uniref:Uncharacterized protein n=1 Tax=Smallanthus sonchifolius TaxID=185202 RepID=A0ACB9JKI6_9ASTR|nr:hypothetical protein L1987_07814 [Smallanthus sonchifolius]
MVMLSRTKAETQSLPGCSDKCGDITIPYPFGIEENCYLDKNYRVNCTTLTLIGSNIKLLDISLDGFMRVALPVAYACFNSTHKLSGSDSKVWTGKQVPLPSIFTGFLIRSRTNTGKIGNWSFNNCSYAFIVEKGHYILYDVRVLNMQSLSLNLPVVLEWTFGLNCYYSQQNKLSYMCKENSVCIEAKYGYNCRCAPGYQGNPYLQNGCQSKCLVDIITRFQ